MVTGRKPKGPAQVEELDGSETAVKRMRAILETIAGTKTVEDVCRELDISQAMFFKMRTRFLEESVQLLEPRPVGRKKTGPSPEEVRIGELERENQDLRLKLEAERVKTEIALVMPHLLRSADQKKTSPERGTGNPGSKKD